MIIGDLVALAKAGYTPAQVKEILALQEQKAESKEEEPAAIIPKEEPQPEPENKQPEAEATEVKNSEAELQSTIESLKAELEKVKSDLAEAQNANVRRDNSGNKPDRTQAINDIVRAFM